MALIRKGLYRHFKGELYKVLELAQHSETEEALVVYQALYADKGIWVRPLSMFNQQLEHQGELVHRFAYCDDQTVVMEVAVLEVIAEQQAAFELAFAEAQLIISSMRGYLTHRLEQCIEKKNRYLLLVEWQTLEDHTEGFRKSEEYQQWRSLLHHFYQPFPVVEHYRSIAWQR